MKNSTLVEKSFKLRFALLLCILIITGAIVLTSFLYFATSESLGSTYGEAIYVINDLKIKIFPLIFSSFYSILILAVITLSIAIISIFFSHKIAGPIYRLEKNLELIGSGDLTVNTKFRADDQLEAIEEDINEMVRSLNYRVRGFADALDEIKRCQERLTRVLEDGSSDENDLMDALEALKQGVKELKKMTSAVKVKEDK